MRSGTTSDRITLNNAIPQATIKCRKCKNCLETLAHILGQCNFTKSDRTRRHDKICNFLAKTLASTPEFQVVEEASIATPSGTLKPDLVVIHRGRVQVVDVTVRHRVPRGRPRKQSRQTLIAASAAGDPTTTRAGQGITSYYWHTRSHTEERPLIFGRAQNHWSWPPHNAGTSGPEELHRNLSLLHGLRQETRMIINAGQVIEDCIKSLFIYLI